MSQRNPMNDRYTREDLGQTRKSAASAKPATKAASSVRVSSGKKKSASTQQDKSLIGRFRKWRSGSKDNNSNAKDSSPNLDFNTPEYKEKRKIWWGIIIAALVVTFGSFWLQGVLPENMQVIGFVALGLGYALLFVAIWYDMSKLRPLRQQQERTYAEKHKPSKRDLRRQAEKEAAERAQREAEEAAKQAKRDERRAKLPAFMQGKKKDADTGAAVPAGAVEVAAIAAEASAEAVEAEVAEVAETVVEVVEAPVEVVEEAAPVVEAVEVVAEAAVPAAEAVEVAVEAAAPAVEAAEAVVDVAAPAAEAVEAVANDVVETIENVAADAADAAAEAK